jgi:uncharacterized protein YceK
MKKPALALALLVLAGCATVREHHITAEPLNTPLTASVGSTLLRVNKKGDLPNAWGAKDIWGGKVDKGYAEVKLVGIRNQRYVDLVAFDVSRDSTETAMDRYRPFDRSLAHVNVSQNIQIGGSPTEAGIPVTIDTAKEHFYILEGVKLTLLQVNPSSLSYTLENISPVTR